MDELNFMNLTMFTAGLFSGAMMVSIGAGNAFLAVVACLIMVGLIWFSRALKKEIMTDYHPRKNDDA